MKSYHKMMMALAPLLSMGAPGLEYIPYKHSESEHEEGYDEHGVWQPLQYHTSWDWLHPAWEKFRDLKTGKPEMHEFKYCQPIAKLITHGTIQQAFEALVEGINWYNTIKENQ